MSPEAVLRRMARIEIEKGIPAQFHLTLPAIHAYVKTMNDNEPLAIGDRVQLRQFPSVQGYIWDKLSTEDTVIVQWDDDHPDENIYVTNPRRWLQKITAPLHRVR
jgi:hypothetical protein